MTFQTLEQKIHETADKSAAAVTDHAASAVEGAKGATGKGGDLVEDVARRAGEIGAQASSTGQRIAGTVVRQVEGQPFAAVLVAGAIGVALGYALAKRP
jgi:ElaB/YqjD/DUF883 family membrane-anchored ribosome-binding protein